MRGQVGPNSCCMMKLKKSFLEMLKGLMIGEVKDNKVPKGKSNLFTRNQGATNVCADGEKPRSGRFLIWGVVDAKGLNVGISQYGSESVLYFLSIQKLQR